MMLDPTKETTFTFFQQFLAEVVTIFPDQFIHLGCDEAQYDCWEHDPQIAQWMQAHNIPTYTALHSYFEQRIQQIANGLGKTVVLWQEAFDHGLNMSASTVAQEWYTPGQNTLHDIVASGRQ